MGSGTLPLESLVLAPLESPLANSVHGVYALGRVRCDFRLKGRSYSFPLLLLQRAVLQA